MRKITHIVIHCSATPEGREENAKSIDRMHRQRGFRCIGYHYVVKLDGTIEPGRPLEQAGAHVEGYNTNSIGVCYVGGVDKAMKAKDTRTDAQKESLRNLILILKKQYPGAEVLGHRDFPKVAKLCPSYDVREWCKEVGI